MTIINKKTVHIDTLTELKEKLDATTAEIAKAFPEDTQEEVIKAENELRQREDDNPEPIYEAHEANDDIITNFVYELGLSKTIYDVLDNRDTRYCLLNNSIGNTVVEVDDIEE